MLTIVLFSAGIEALPFPWVIAHKGGSLLWPEETMEAYAASTSAGNHFVDVDCVTLQDGSVGLMHDGTVNRTTNGTGDAEMFDANRWSRLRVEGSKVAGDPSSNYHVPFLDEVLAHFRNRVILSIEPKDDPSASRVVAKLKEYRIDKNFVFVNAFGIDKLRPALAAGYKTCLNLPPNAHDTPKAIKRLGIWAVALPSTADERTIRAFKKEGLKVLIYTINRQFYRDQMIRWGADGFYTDDPMYLGSSSSYRRTSDPFSSAHWPAGMLPALPDARGVLKPNGTWTIDASEEDRFKNCLQGWMCPIGGGVSANDWTMDLSIAFSHELPNQRWASVGVWTTDAPQVSDARAADATSGYNVLFHVSGGISVYRYDGDKSGPVLLGTINGPGIRDGEDVRYRISVKRDHFLVERVGTNEILRVQDGTYRGAYVTFGAKGLSAAFSKIFLHPDISK